MRNVTVKYLRKNDRTGSFEYRRRVPKSLEKLVTKREFLKVLGKTQSEAVMRYPLEQLQEALEKSLKIYRRRAPV